MSTPHPPAAFWPPNTMTPIIRYGARFACKTFLVSSVPKRNQQRHILDTLRNEIDLLRSLDHPNIVRAYESYQIGQDLHLIMELCRGGGTVSVPVLCYAVLLCAVLCGKFV